jgi:sulfhydrogenase subunit delta
MDPKRKPKLAVFKFASCDGCQLTLLDCEEELLTVTERLELAFFKEATRAEVKGPYDLTLVDGSITTPQDATQIKRVRRASKFLVAIGTCATSGGIQALRNFKDVEDFIAVVYPRPQYIRVLQESTPLSAHVPVDFELHGCPVNPRQLLEVISAFLWGRKPNTPAISVCMECKRRHNVCVLVAHGTPCLGPVTRAGCGALCPTYHRGCYGCYGPKETPNTASLSSWFGRRLGVSEAALVRVFRSFYANAEAFRQESTAHEK